MNAIDITIEIFNKIFNAEQIKNMIEIDNSENNNIWNLSGAKIKNETQIDISDKIIDNSNDDNKLENDHVVLASYSKMNNSPGVITFYTKNIKLYVCSLINSLDYSSPIGLNIALYFVCFVVLDLTKHESFHYYSDFKRHITGSEFNIKTEERLAVAHSFNIFSLPIFRRGYNINYYNLYNRFIPLYDNPKHFDRIRIQNKTLYKFLLNEHFSSYQSVNYQNWHIYSNMNCYKTEYFNYFKNSLLEELLKNGVPVNRIFEEIEFLGIAGCIIRIT